MNKTEYAEYLQSAEWQQRRTNVLFLRGHRCEVCGATGPGMEIHHLRYDNLGHEPMEDLQVVCPTCHAAAHGLAPVPAGLRRVRFLYGET